MNDTAKLDLNRERSVPEILCMALKLYSVYPWLFLTLALAVIGPYDLAVLAASGHGPLSRLHEGFATSVLLGVLEVSLVTPLISALHIHAVAIIGEGLKPRLVRVAMIGIRVLPVVSAADIVASLGILAGLLALIIPGILLIVRWAVVAQSAALEQDGWLSALRRSGQLARGRYWHIFGLLLVTTMMSKGLRLGVGGVVSAPGRQAGSVILGIGVDTVVASVTALTLAILYFDLVAHEGTRLAVEPSDCLAD